MVIVKACSHARKLLEMFAISGEFPMSALSLLGSERTLKTLIHKLTLVHDIYDADNHFLGRARLISVSGKRNDRNIRLSKSALPILNLINEKAALYYSETFGKRRLSSDISHISRNHRVSEAIAMCIASGIEAKSYALPKLSLIHKDRRIMSKPSFYIARELKQTGNEELNKTSYTRFVGALFYPGNCYAVYNTRNAVMKWSASGERKAIGLLTDIARMNAGIHEVNCALLFGRDENTALQTVMESDRSKRQYGRMDRIYQRILFVPLNSSGIRALKILTLPNWNEKLLNSLFESTQRLKIHSSIECDSIIDGKLIFSHLDCDLARLLRLRDALFDRTETVEVICYTWQVNFLGEYLGDRVKLIPIEMDAIEGALGITKK